QLHGSYAQGAGQALIEGIVYDADGQLLTASLMDYAAPRADDFPEPVIGEMHTPSPNNPLGAKGVGEAGCIALPPAIVNAVVDALRPWGCTPVDMPLTSDEVWSGDGRPILYVERPTYLLRTVFAYVLAAIAASMVMAWTGEVVAAGGSALGALASLLGSGLALATFIVVSMSARPLRHVTVFRDESRREVLLRVWQDQRVAVLARTYTVVTAVGLPLAR